jgi:hypothetical protein
MVTLISNLSTSELMISYAKNEPHYLSRYPVLSSHTHIVLVPYILRHVEGTAILGSLKNILRPASASLDKSLSENLCRTQDRPMFWYLYSYIDT